MTQTIITYIIIAGAVLYTIYSLYSSLFAKTMSHCDGCKGCSTLDGPQKKIASKDLNKKLMEIKDRKTQGNTNNIKK